MAGRKMIIVGSDPQLLQQLASMPERWLSSRRAVADMGFEYVLGRLNVYEGTDWHKKILKNYVAGTSNNNLASRLPNLYAALQLAMTTEIRKQKEQQQHPTTASTEGDEQVEIPDLFSFSRRIALRATLDEFVSPRLLQQDSKLLEDLMIFQDKLEDAIAQSAVLPRWLALIFFLRPVQSLREGLQRRIAKILPIIMKEDNSNNKVGPWLQDYQTQQTASAIAAEHLIGLIFAAHKNPSIGAAQCLCFLRQELTKEQQQNALREAQKLCDMFEAVTTNISENDIDSSQQLLKELLEAKTLRTCVLETNRLVAHTLGALRCAVRNIPVEISPKQQQQQRQSPRKMVIHAGEAVSFAHHTMHMESSLWGQDASTFLLDRPEWTSSNDKEGKNQVDIGVPIDQYKYTTFSNGVHKCPGERVALAMMEIVLALFVQRQAQFVGEVTPLSFERATLAQREGPCKIRLTAQ